MAPREMRRFPERKASWHEASRDSLGLGDPLSVPECSGCPKLGTEVSPRQGRGAQDSLAANRSPMGRNSPMNDFCTVGLCSLFPFIAVDLIGGIAAEPELCVPPSPILRNRASSQRAKVRASLVDRVHQGPLIMAKAMVIIYSLRWMEVFRRNSVKRRGEKLSLSSADIKMDFYFLKDPPRRERISVNLIYAPQLNSRNRNKS